MLDQDSIGAIKVPRMIWTSTILSLGSLLICWLNCPKDNPSIMQTAMEYPYTIIFRVGLMYSLFILFLEALFIKWWLDSSSLASSTKKIVILSTISFMAYALFVSTIDRKRINYGLAEDSVFVAALANFAAISLIMKNLKTIRQTQPHFIGFLSWKLKKTISLIFFTCMTLGFVMYLGVIDIYYKNQIQYGVVVSSYLFYWSFIMDFRKFSMDIEKLPHQ